MAIAITLLIIEIGVPHVTGDESLGNRSPISGPPTALKSSVSS